MKTKLLTLMICMSALSLLNLAYAYHPVSPYAFCFNNPVKYIDPNGKDAVLVVFPDYKISTPVGKIGGLGHAGVILIDPIKNEPN